jgi:hypothetical protein
MRRNCGTRVLATSSVGTRAGELQQRLDRANSTVASCWRRTGSPSSHKDIWDSTKPAGPPLP